MAERNIRRGGLQWSQLRVAILAILALLILGYGVYQVGKIFDVFAERYPLITFVESAAGLTEGAAVTLAGQQVGQVRRIDFLPLGERTGERNLRIELSVSREAHEQIRADSEAQILTQGLLGDKYINISPGSPAAPILDPGEVIPSAEVVGMQMMIARAAETLAEVEAVASDLERITSALVRGEGTLGKLLNDETLYRELVGVTTELEQTLAAIGNREGTLGRLLYDPTLYVELVDAVARVDSIATLALSGGGTLGRLLRSDTLYERLVGAAAGADTTLANVNELVTAATEGGGTIERLLRDPELYEQLLKAVIDLQTLIQDIRERPGRYSPQVDVF